MKVKEKRDVIYVVFGSTGEYSDREEWPIIAVQTAEQAQLLVGKLDEIARVCLVDNLRDYSQEWKERKRLETEAIAQLNAFLPGAVLRASIDYTELHFWYAEVATA